jgi:hypothetical protein
MVGIPVSVLGLGLAGFMAVRMANKAPADDFAKELEKADAAGLQLAQGQSARQFSLSETVPETKPEAKTVTKRAPSGAKAVRSKSPTVKAAPENVAADVVEEVPDMTAMQQSSGPTHTEAPVPVDPEPSPATSPAPAQDQGPILRGGNGTGAGRNGAGSGGGWGTIFGAIIRGGGVDGDNCDPRGRRTGSGSQRPVYGRPDYGSNPGMGTIRTGGWGGGTTITGAPTTIGGTRPRGR